MSNEDTSLAEQIHPNAPGFKERITPKDPDGSVHFFTCNTVLADATATTGEVVCKGVHFRHAGYVEMMLPFMELEGAKRMGVESVHVKICVKCKSAYVWTGRQMFDVTDKVDLRAWEKTEKEAQAATGPGGQC